MKLKINVKKINSCEKKLSIDVPQDIVTEEFASFYRSVGKRAKIPGFRPGHAPNHVVALHYRDRARDVVLKQLLLSTLWQAVEQEDLQVIGYPKVENVDFDESHLKFDALVEMKPKVKIDKYTGLSLSRDPFEATESEVSGALRRLQEARAKFVAVENRAATLSDFVICDYRLEVDGQEVEKREGEWIELRDHDYLEGFSKQLVNAIQGETREVLAAFPADYVRKELAGKKGKFIVTIKEIKEKEVPALDEEFVKDIGEHHTVKELTEAVRKDVEAQKKEEGERKLERDLLDELVKKSKFDVPKGSVGQRLDALVEERIRTLMYRGLSEEQANQERDNLKKKLEAQAEQDVRISFILDEVACRERIEVTEADVESRLKAVAESVKRPLKEVQAYYSQDHDRLDSLKYQIEHKKTVQWIKERANIREGK